MKRLVVFFSILLSLSLTTTVFAAAYTATYVITETNGTTYTMLGIIEDSPSTWLAANGYIEADALDTRIETLAGLEKPHLVTDDKILTAVPIPADSQTNLNFTTGNSDLTSMDIITGYGGYYTIPDAAALELGNNFEVEVDGYIDTSAGADKYLVQKLSAFELYVSAASTVTARIVNSAYVSPTGHVDPSLTWNSEANAYDNNLGTRADSLSLATGWTNFLELTRAATTCSSVQYYVVGGGAGVDQIDIDVYYGGAWNHIYEGAAVEVVLTTVSLGGTYSISNYRVRLHHASGGAGGVCYFYEGYYGSLSYTTVSETPVTSGDKNIKVTADTVNLKLFIDSVEVDTIALAGASVPDNTNRWYLSQNNVTPYMDFYKQTVGGVLIAWYQPVTIITNTSFDGTADAGGDANTIIDAALTQADDYWNFALVTITDTTDDAAPKGETSVVLDFAAATDEITLATNLTAGVDAGDTYTVEFGTLVDRQGAAQDARITWGVNPTGIAIALGSLTSISQPSAGQTIDSPDIDILPPVSTSDWYEQPDVTGALLTNPLRPFVTIMSDATSMTEMQAWRLLGLAFVLFCTVAAAVAVRNHLLIAGIICGAAIGLMVAFTIFPLWSVVFIIGAVAAGIVAERSPSL